MGQIELGKIVCGEKKKKCFCSDKREGWEEREREIEREREGCPSIVKPQLTCIVLTPPRY